jgi:putative DNA primase/helicase
MAAPSPHSSACNVALALAGVGLYVFPCCWPDTEGHCACPRGHAKARDVGKAPLTPHGFKDATQDPATIAAWWAEWPEANVAIDLARSGLVMIDPDSPAAEVDVRRRGMEPTTIRHSRNRAYLCRRTPACPTISATRLGASGELDLKADGYAIVCGRHREGQDIWLEDFEPADVPDWVVELLQAVARHQDGRAVAFTPDPEAAAKGEALYPIIRRRLPERIQRTIEEGPDAYTAAPESGNVVRLRPPDLSRSGADGSVVYYLVGLGLSDDDIRNLYEALPVGTRGKYAERGAPYLRATIGNQRAFYEKVGARPPAAAPSTNGHRDAAAPPPNGRDPAVDEDAPETFATTDLGNAERLVAQHGADVRYCAPWASWLLWGGSHWERDTSLGIHRRAKQTVRHIYHEAAEADTKEARRELAAWARRSEAEARINAMLALARPHVGVQPQDLNRDPWLLNVLNGTLDLRTARLVPHDRHDLITKRVPVRYDSTAACPTFAAFLQTILAERPELISFLQRAIGYSLTGDTREQVLFILHGLGSNGKSTLLDVCHGLLGDYAKNTPFETFLHRDRDVIRNDLAALFGGRLVSASEIEPGQRLSEGLVKSLTGSDPITARFLFQESFTFAPTFKLWLSCNHKPTIRGTDHAIWRRIRLVPFTVQIPDAQQDKQLGEKLRAELPGILNWALAGCLAWQEHGLGLPEAVKDATQAYRDEMDVLGDFLAEQCVEDPQAYVPAAALYAAYLAWCEPAGEKPISQQAFGRLLRERGCTDGRVGKPQKRVWYGLRLVGDLDE